MPPGEGTGSAVELPGILLDQVGALTVLRDGHAEPLFAGVIAIRARIRSAAPPGMLELWLGEGAERKRVAAAPASEGPGGGGALGLHVVNLWLDSGRLPEGRHWLSLSTTRQALVTGLYVNVAAAGGMPDLAGSNSWVPSPPSEVEDVAAAVTAAPAEVRSAGRSIFDRPIRSVLAVRVDQLGDVAASLPAIARLRAVFPDARLTVLVQPAVRPIVEASGIADRILTVDLAFDARSESYALSEDEERRLAPLLAAEGFDLAVDLCTAPQTRPLLLMTGATWLAGFNPYMFPFLDYGIDVRSRDKANQLDIVPHGATVMTLVEGLAAATTGTRPPVRRMAAPAPAIAGRALADAGYVVIHSGSRYPINRWPLENFHALARHLVQRTDLDIVFFCDDAGRPLPADLAESGRVHPFGVLEPDAFDAIVSGARLFVGNDSGPKHLAAVRGVPTVSAHVDRLNWNEWGQEGRGAILSKRVPCTGCGLNDIALCGLDAICVRSIGVDEMLEAALAQL